MMAMVCLPVLICVAVLLFRKNERSASVYLALFFLLTVFGMGPQIIGYAGFYTVWPGLTYFPLFYTELWLGPLLYLHADKLMREGQLGWRKYLLVPGAVQTFYYCWAFFTLGGYQNKWAYNASTHQPYVVPIESLAAIGLLVLALILIWHILRNYRSFLEATSSAAYDFDPVWLRNLVIAILGAGGLYVGLEIIEAFRPVSYVAAFPFQVLIMAILAWLALDAAWRLTKPFPKMNEGPDVQAEDVPTEKDWAEEAARLKKRMTGEEWFLHAGLSIRDIANRMGTNETYISRTLNTGLGMSFNRFVNSLRVEYAKTLMLSGSGALLTIALKSGFNSKATFNRVFRDQTGMTPSQFIASQKL